MLESGSFIEGLPVVPMSSLSDSHSHFELCRFNSGVFVAGLITFPVTRYFLIQ